MFDLYRPPNLYVDRLAALIERDLLENCGMFGVMRQEILPKDPTFAVSQHVAQEFYHDARRPELLSHLARNYSQRIIAGAEEVLILNVLPRLLMAPEVRAHDVGGGVGYAVHEMEHRLCDGPFPMTNKTAMVFAVNYETWFKIERHWRNRAFSLTALEYVTGQQRPAIRGVYINQQPVDVRLRLLDRSLIPDEEFLLWFSEDFRLTYYLEGHEPRKSWDRVSYTFHAWIDHSPPKEHERRGDVGQWLPSVARVRLLSGWGEDRSVVDRLLDDAEKGTWSF